MSNNVLQGMLMESICIYMDSLCKKLVHFTVYVMHNGPDDDMVQHFWDSFIPQTSFFFAATSWVKNDVCTVLHSLLMQLTFANDVIEHQWAQI